MKTPDRNNGPEFLRKQEGQVVDESAVKDYNRISCVMEAHHEFFGRNTGTV